MKPRFQVPTAARGNDWQTTMHSPTVNADERAMRFPVLDGADAARRWIFLTNHFLVLLSVARSPGLRVRDIAEMVGITERATQAILSDLDRDGYIERTRIGRRNRYHVHRYGGLRHPLVGSITVGDVLGALLAEHPPEEQGRKAVS
jgi:hypothetical protein